ncbi:PP0621 family protein [Polaromonas sp.]|uniref:PP0621 family protein n=1 Tax=Polaromonas sp. TaxID=1869339 RepID=UPI002FCAC7BF
MKYLLVIAVVLVGFWLWRNNRRAELEQRRTSRPDTRPGPPTQATEMVACDVCAVHLPRSEALIGRRGIYCSDAHRQQAGD